MWNNIKKQLKKMDKIILFYIAIVLSIVGFTLLGIGIGKIFNEYWVGTLTGLGTGMLIAANLILKTVRRIIVYEKK